MGKEEEGIHYIFLRWNQTAAARLSYEYFPLRHSEAKGTKE